MPGAANHGSPTRGGDTSVFDPVTGRWVPAVQPYGRAGNPSGTAAERAFDRAAGTNTSGAYPGVRR